MTDPISPARRRAEAAFSLLTHATTPLQRAVDDAQSDADERALKTQRLRNSRLERERNGQPLSVTPRKHGKITPAGDQE